MTEHEKLATTLLKGLKGAEIVSRRVEREQATLHTVKVGGKFVAEVIARRTLVRLNLRVPVPGGDTAPAREGKVSAQWLGGGFLVTEANLAEARARLEAAVAGTPARRARKRGTT
jgi:hypothetical protein